MNLYEIKFEHYSQKDSEVGIVAYAIAENDEEIYEFIKTDPKINENTSIYTSWKYYEEEGIEYEKYDESFNWMGVESFKEYIVRVGGEMYSEYVDLDDLYYGKTLYGWELIKANIQEHQTNALMETIGLVVLGE